MVRLLIVARIIVGSGNAACMTSQVVEYEDKAEAEAVLQQINSANTTVAAVRLYLKKD